MEAFAALMLLGVRVREVRNLDEQVVWLPHLRLLLIDSELSECRRQRAASQLIGEAARRCR